MQLRDYQSAAADDAAAVLESGSIRLYSAPTGSGKSLIELEVLRRRPGAWLVTPRVEIIYGMLAKLGISRGSRQAVMDAAWERRICTPQTLSNRMLAGVGPVVREWVLDEAHHDEAGTWRNLEALSGPCPRVGFTATPFRGSPRSTRALLDRWGEPVPIITLREAVALGHVSMPECSVVPLVDDDVVAISGGEFQVRAASDAVQTRLGAVVEHCLRWHSTSWDMPTVFAMPGREVARELAKGLGFASVVDGDTPYRERLAAFASCVTRETALVQVDVVSEGVDLPLRRLVDLRPSVSPVRWLQQFGRITRPGARSEYVCMCRNLLRHAYLLEGLVPVSVLSDGQRSFPPTDRDCARAVGLEALGRLRPSVLPFADGLRGQMWCASAVDGAVVTEWCALVHPVSPEVVWARRERGYGGTSYGRWVRASAPDGLEGFASVVGSKPSDKQLAWWRRAAGRYGLDAGYVPSRREFQALPVLVDTKWRF